MLYLYYKQNKKNTTMKATTLQKRLDNRYQGSKNTIAYKVVTDVINKTNNSCRIFWENLIRPVRTSGSGRFTTTLDYTRDVENLLDLIGVKYISGNDAPRGGATGNFIKIITKIN